MYYIYIHHSGLAMSVTYLLTLRTTSRQCYLTYISHSFPKKDYIFLAQSMLRGAILASTFGEAPVHVEAVLSHMSPGLSSNVVCAQCPGGI